MEERVAVFAEHQRIAVIAAHPDDDVLGCGGAISNFVRMGHDVKTLFFSTGVASRYHDAKKGEDESSIARLSEMKRSHAIMGVENYKILGFPDNKLDTVPLLDLARECEEFLNVFKPTIIFTHSIKDLNIDHQLVSAAVTVACRPNSNNFAHTVLFFEVPSSTNWQIDSAQSVFDPRFYVDISKTIDAKVSALMAYKSETQEFPHPRSEVYIRALAQVRGAACGLESAEGFEVGRIIR